MDETNYFNIETKNNNPKLTLDDMWKATNWKEENGIEGYEIKKKYFDYQKSKNEKKIWEKNNSKKVRADWPPHALKDDSGNINWPKRKNYLDDIQKWAKSFYDKEKAEKVIEYLEDKGRPIDKTAKKDPIAQNLQRMNLQGDRKTFIDWIKRNEEKKYIQYPEREDKIEEIKDKLADYYKNKKSNVELMKEKYQVKGSLAKCDRITIVSDAEHVGEKMPFCNSKKDDGEKSAVGKRTELFKNKITFPSKVPIWTKAPAWKILGPLKKTDPEQQVLDNKREIDQERARSARETIVTKWKTEDLNIHLAETFNKMKKYKNENIGFGKITYMKEEEQEKYKEFLKEHPKKHPGPTFYWKTKPLDKDFRKDKKRPKYETVITDNGAKTYYIDRSITDKIVSRPMSSHIF